MKNQTSKIKPMRLRALLVPLLLAAAGLQSAAAEEIVARLAFHWSPTHHSAVHAQMFADEVNRRAAGRLRIEVFPSKQLFGVREIMGAVTAGSVEMGGILGVVSFPPIDKNFNIANFPDMFDSYRQQRRFFTDTETGRRMWRGMEEKANATLIMYDPVGPVMTFSAARQLDSVAAMKGLKARALIKLERPRWKALGANAVSLPTGEVYTSLQSGLIDTINSPPIGVKAYSWWEFLKFGQLPYQYFADAYLMANRAWFNNLPRDLRELMLEVGRDMGQRSTDTIMQTAEGILAEFKQRGGVVTTLSGRRKAEFDELMQDSILPRMTEMVDPAVLKAAQDFVGR
ncbi:MAG: TRAP transporter substrate-binding protein [Gammaproteobacteria bacterium]|nr:TRAP transporter substrate-binding protein [Gammaproteobacteria bacterium]MDD9798918.1 TRAP transporter substrate-binding protein [Gammaproteobacteria bacterium]MDD9815673.1 TRAP transporter substrate-binding protein [Gammaproteobacteria bacterium]MDD9851599.1 TRAP transporter substrate-binding protein [Gammaproteobacteria bacterium]MDD9871579.1 TRAP transporter substrate-binding protein [Gammaproteobacteria bacterium]